ncbi:hypothetical protein NBO_4g0011 [Nosema bombycis CQ1]|uniref:Uncharacterized protein n=1 Tax=Nosema bombycis (strain CQ1 / CVCC 102059) TaxID=578461 RepID=R0MR83_NOSB1|nr:hypothetical protein NBO_4g0011 [Nosema bombycis CQ1]|eukprot:EOB15383.1 hypothetical protein NBO_4g0011 [Nosema bombycis CQ1]
MFKTRFIETVEKRLSLFELLNKLFRMFFLFDNYRNKYVSVFHAFSVFKINERSRLEEKDNLRYSTFCCIGMPMARLFVSYFTADGHEIYHPVVLKKRATIFLNDTKKDYLLFLNTLIVENTDLKYVKMFLCALHEKINGNDPFTEFFETLKKTEKNYYIDMVNIL